MEGHHCQRGLENVRFWKLAVFNMLLALHTPTPHPSQSQSTLYAVTNLHIFPSLSCSLLLLSSWWLCCYCRCLVPQWESRNVLLLLYMFGPTVGKSKCSAATVDVWFHSGKVEMFCCYCRCLVPQWENDDDDGIFVNCNWVYTLWQ